MDKLIPRRLNRDQLQSFLGPRPDLIKAFETFLQAVSTDIPDELEALLIGLTSATAQMDVLTSITGQAAKDAELGRLLPLSGAVDQLREQIAALPSTGTQLATLEAQIEQLRQEVAAMGPRRVIRDSITLIAGVSTDSIVISPPISGRAVLAHLGVITSSSTTGAGSVAISLSGSTVTANRGANATDATVRFQILEY